MLLQDMEPALGVCARCGVPGLARQGRECNASPRAGQHEERVPPKEARHRLGPCVPSLCPHQAAQPPHTSGARVPGGELQAAPHPWVGAPRFPAICAADLIRNENWVCFSFFFSPFSPACGQSSVSLPRFITACTGSDTASSGCPCARNANEPACTAAPRSNCKVYLS